MRATQQLSGFSPRTAAIAVAAAATVLLSASNPVLAAAAPHLQPAEAQLLSPTLLPSPTNAQAPIDFQYVPLSANPDDAAMLAAAKANNAQTGAGAFDPTQQDVFPDPSPLAPFNIDIAQYAPGLNLEQQTRLASYMPGFLAKIHAKDNHNTAAVDAADPADSSSPSRRAAGACPARRACLVAACGAGFTLGPVIVTCLLGQFEYICPASMC